MATPSKRGEHVEITTAEDILKKMRAGTSEIHEIRCRQMVFHVRVLSLAEVNEVRKDALKGAIAIKGDEVDKNVLMQQSILKIASTVNKGGGPVISDKLLSLMSTDEVNYLYDEYMRVCELVNPNVEEMTDDQFRVMVDSLKKSTLTAKDLSLPQLRMTTTAYVDLLQRLESQGSPAVN